MYRRVLTLVIVVLAVLVSTSAYGSHRMQARSEIGLDYGAMNLDSDVSRENADRSMIRGGYFFNRYFQLEGQIGSTVSGNVFGNEERTDLEIYMVNGVYNFRPIGIAQVYALAGVGNVTTDIDSRRRARDDSSVAYQIGTGSRFALGQTERMAIRTEVSAMREDTFDKNSTHTSVQAGLTWRLGRRN